MLRLRRRGEQWLDNKLVMIASTNAATAALNGSQDLQPGIEHRLGKIQLHLPIGCDRNRRDAERHVLGLDRIEQFFDRRLDDKFGLRVYLFGDLLPELDAEAGKLAVLFIDERFDETGCDAKLLLFRLGKSERNDQNEKRHKQRVFSFAKCSVSAFLAEHPEGRG